VMFVMEQYRMSWEDALQLVQNKRYCISPNGGFLTQIKEYESICRAKVAVTTNPPRHAPDGMQARRKREEDSDDDDDRKRHQGHDSPITDPIRRLLNPAPHPRDDPARNKRGRDEDVEMS